MIDRAPRPDSAADSSPEVPAHLEHTLDERWRRYRKAFGRCRKDLSEDSVHQLRVETRRLLALLDLLDTLAGGEELEALRDTLKKFFRSFARLRDTQVQWLFVDQHRRRFPEVEPFAKALTRLEKRLVRKLDKQVRRIGRKRIKKLVSALREVLDPALAEAGLRRRGRAMVTGRVSQAFRRVVVLRGRIRPDRPLTIHRTRVAFKRFRYLTELLQPLLPGVTLRQLQEMHEYQTLMGEIQDLEVLQGALDEFAKADEEAAAELARFRGEIERQHTARIARYLEAADQLFQFWPPHPRSPRQSPPKRASTRTSAVP
jgi:CHAD domain-containing protein